MAGKYTVRSYAVRVKGKTHRRWFVKNPEGLSICTHATRWEDALRVANRYAANRALAARTAAENRALWPI
jgi:hypothetical protein